MMAKKIATKKTAFFDAGKAGKVTIDAVNCKRTPIIFDPEKAFERMSDWLEKKKVANWVIMLAAVYMLAQIIRAIFN